MRIGILPTVAPNAGGVYQNSLIFLRALDELKTEGLDDEFVLFYRESQKEYIRRMPAPPWPWQPIDVFPASTRSVLTARLNDVREGLFRGRIGRLLAPWTRKRRTRVGEASTNDPYAIRFRPDLGQWLRKCGIRLMLYPSPAEFSFESGIPYVMAIHDLQHRLQPQFPEVGAPLEYQWREYLFGNGARCATLLLADSETGKEDILQCYGGQGITADRVKVLPYVPLLQEAVNISPSEVNRVCQSYALPASYFLYPAQFWPHKNHVRIVEAMGILKNRYGLAVDVVFAGSHDAPVGEQRSETYTRVLTTADDYCIRAHIHAPGYVPDADLKALYAGARGLVMPTFFGPTNIPPLEAWAFGCPVITSDIRGIREQMGDAAVLVDPQSAEAIADGMAAVWQHSALREELVARGRVRLRQFNSGDYRKRLGNIVEEAKRRQSCR